MRDFDGYTATYVTATGYSCITSGPAAISAVLVQASATGAFELFASSTATGSTAITGVVRAYSTTGSATVQSAVLFEFPAIDCPAGICIRNNPSADPKLTIFWRPMGSATSAGS